MTELRKNRIVILHQQLSELTVAYLKAVETDQTYELRKNMQIQMRRIENEIAKLKKEEHDNDAEGQTP